jgi:hypothetical protein
MMDRRLVGLAILTLFLTGLAGQAQAGISLGSTQSSKHATIEQGGEGSLRIFLFNAHQEEDLYIYTGVYDDGGLSVVVEPESLTVPYTEPGRYTESEPGFVYIGTPQGDVRARAVTVRVSVPFKAELGEHKVVAYAATERQEGTLGTAQIRKFYFTVDVEEGEGIGLGEEIRAEAGEEEPSLPEEPEGPEGPEEPEGLDSLPDSVTGAVTDIPVFGPYILAGVLVLFLILRRVKRI